MNAGLPVDAGCLELRAPVATLVSRRALAVLDVVAAWCIQLGRCTATAILVRHADVSASTGPDPSLNTVGLARAQELRHVSFF